MVGNLTQTVLEKSHIQRPSGGESEKLLYCTRHANQGIR